MASVTAVHPASIVEEAAPSQRGGWLPAFVTLALRRLALSVRTPRELFVPLLTPILFALVIAPALKVALHTSAAYESFVAIGTVGLLIPLNTMFSGLSVIIDRESGARRELLAAPIPRPLLVLGNFPVALGVTAFQVVALIVAALARGIDFHASATGIVWFVAAATLFATGMYGIAETLASRVPKQEEYISRVPAIAILPWFLAGSLFPISALPTFLGDIAKVLPLTHGLALMRYGLLGDRTGLHNIWGMHDATAMAALSLGVVGLFAAVLTAVSVRVFVRASVQ
jgi:ABC-type multidrug transport system permease subunit